MATWGSFLREIAQILERNPLVAERRTAEAEATTLACAALLRAGQPGLPDPTRSGIWMAADREVPAVVAVQIRSWAEGRASGKILQHLTREQAFLDHLYEVGPEVLVPRVETEVLAVTAIEVLEELPSAPTLGFEVGLGSGVLSIELLHRFPALRMVATERSLQARALAERNAVHVLGHDRAQALTVLDVERAEEVLAPLERWVLQTGLHADFFVSNPPYLARESLEETDAEVREQEPLLALFPEAGLPGGEDPLVFYRHFASGLGQLLKAGAPLFLELAAERAPETAALFEAAEDRGQRLWTDVRLCSDFTGLERFLVARAVGSSPRP